MESVDCNFQHKCIYQNLSKFIEFKDSDDLDKANLELINYRNDFLSFFKVNTYDNDLITNKIDQIFKIIQHEPFFCKVFETLGGTSSLSLVILFSFDYFYLLLPCLNDFRQNILDNSENREKLLKVIENKHF